MLKNQLRFRRRAATSMARLWRSPKGKGLVTTGIIIGASAISVLNAQANAPYFEVAAINVTDQADYEASGVDKVRDAIKAGGVTVAPPCYQNPPHISPTSGSTTDALFV